MRRYIPIEKKDQTQSSPQKVYLSASSERLKKYYYEKERYHCIDKNLLFPESELIFSLFIQRNLNYELLLEAFEDSPKKPSAETLNYDGDIFIKVTDIPLYQQYLETISSSSYQWMISDKQKIYSIRERSKIFIRDLLSAPENSQNIKKCGELIELIINSILCNKEIFYDLIKIKEHDYYTYVHSVNVGILSVGLGIAAGLSKTNIYNLGIGSLLHDIGKCKISSEILNKLGRLNPFEYRILKNHVIEGEKILKDCPYFPENSLSAVTQHHERLSGKGYPNNLTGAQITIFGKIVAITDSYDALTTKRPDKAGLTPFEALSILVKECEHYDSDLLKLFIKLIGGVI
ncbi:MAG: HD domain-containing protein [Thermodesulfovibrionales bacterium]|nr:HD domain-containing protein [Thermodesulfovibrionales bacterium]